MTTNRQPGRPPPALHFQGSARMVFGRQRPPVENGGFHRVAVVPHRRDQVTARTVRQASTDERPRQTGDAGRVWGDLVPEERVDLDVGKRRLKLQDSEDASDHLPSSDPGNAATTFVGDWSSLALGGDTPSLQPPSDDDLDRALAPIASLVEDPVRDERNPHSTSLEDSAGQRGSRRLAGEPANVRVPASSWRSVSGPLLSTSIHRVRPWLSSSART